MVKKIVEGGHRGAKYALAVISIFEGGIPMRQGLMYIANMKKNMLTLFTVHFKSNIVART